MKLNGRIKFQGFPQKLQGDYPKWKVGGKVPL